MAEKRKILKHDGLSLRIFLAILITIGGFFSLALGDHLFMSRGDTLTNKIWTYVVPFLYLFTVYWLVRKFHFFNDYFFEKTKIPLQFMKTLVFGVFFMLIALGISFLGNVAPFMDKKPVDNFAFILMQLIVYCLCIGFFEEGLFRGVMLRILFKDESKKSLWTGFLVSSVMFGMIHLGNLTVGVPKPIATVTQVIYAMLLGMTLAALYLSFKSFIGIGILHALIDFISYYGLLYGHKAEAAADHIGDIRLLDAGATVGVLVPSAILGTLLLLSFSKKHCVCGSHQPSAGKSFL